MIRFCHDILIAIYATLMIEITKAFGKLIESIGLQRRSDVRRHRCHSVLGVGVDKRIFTWSEKATWGISNHAF
jgi:hypothetical protein